MPGTTAPALLASSSAPGDRGAEQVAVAAALQPPGAGGAVAPHAGRRHGERGAAVGCDGAPARGRAVERDVERLAGAVVHRERDGRRVARREGLARRERLDGDAAGDQAGGVEPPLQLLEVVPARRPRRAARGAAVAAGGREGAHAAQGVADRREQRVAGPGRAAAGVVRADDAGHGGLDAAPRGRGVGRAAARVAGRPGHGRVDAGEQVALARGRHVGVHARRLAPHAHDRRPLPLRPALPLRLVLRAADGGELRVAAAERGVVAPGVVAQRRRLGAAVAGVAVELRRRPRGAERGRREAHGVGREVVRLAREDAARLVVPVPVGRRAAEDRDDHVRPERAHGPHHVAEHRVARPVPERLLGALAEAEVEGAAKYWRPPSSRRAASSSSVRTAPSASPSSLPMRFCPPSPRVSDR
jgi:hypothetical protein